MKKSISISIICLLMTGMLHFSIAHHYCSGFLAASRVSLSGQLASCGMESTDTGIPETGFAFTHHCCDDVLLYFVNDNDYIQSNNLILDSPQYKIQNSDISFLYSDIPLLYKKSFVTNVMPPGMGPSAHTECSDICVFRI